MLDTCTVTRVTGKTFDPETRLNVPTVTTIYSGKCEMKMPGTDAETARGPGQVEDIQKGVLKLPATGAVAVREGDQVLIDTSLNPAMVGLKATIRGGHYQSAATARRLAVEVIK